MQAAWIRAKPWIRAKLWIRAELWVRAELWMRLDSGEEKDVINDVTALGGGVEVLDSTTVKAASGNSRASTPGMSFGCGHSMTSSPLQQLRAMPTGDPMVCLVR
jgi:hypothetical protein